MSLARALVPTAVTLLLGLLLLLAGPVPELTAAAAGQITWAVHISLAPTWFDPAETPGMITPTW